MINLNSFIIFRVMDRGRFLGIPSISTINMMNSEERESETPSLDPQQKSTVNVMNSEDRALGLEPQQRQTLAYTIQINGNSQLPSLEETYNHLANNFEEEYNCPKQEQIQYREKVTGYEVNKDALNEEEIIKAFKIIDVNKDEVITKDDLQFMLKYISEDYTSEEVDEMISMVSSDKKQVTLEDFKKIGKAQIIPLANFKIPNEEWKKKAKVLEQIQKTDLFHEDPDKLKRMMDNGDISFQKFEQAKKVPIRQTQPQESETPEKQFEKLVKKLPVKSAQELKRRKSKFSNINLINIFDIEKNYRQYENRIITSQQIGKMLQIGEPEAKILYPSGAYSLFVLMEAIVYSTRPNIKKLQQCLEYMNKRMTVSFKELLHGIMLVRGEDSGMQKKLIAVLKHKSINLEDQINKLQAVEIIKQYLTVFMF